MSQENVELVEKLFEAMSRGDVEAALQHVRPDGEWVNPDDAMVQVSAVRAMRPSVPRAFGSVVTLERDQALTRSQCLSTDIRRHIPTSVVAAQLSAIARIWL